LVVGLILGGLGMAQKPVRVELVFTGGHDADPRDHGRPVALIAAALGVPPEVFREAFRHVTPARGGAEPEPEQVRRNKTALMGALSKYGVTNERLDEVSNYYRYNRERGDILWRNSAAAGYATVQDGKVVAVTVTRPGSGYSSTPEVSVPGMPGVKVFAVVGFGKELSGNGSIDKLAF
jgi:hypothetical protein